MVVLVIVVYKRKYTYSLKRNAAYSNTMYEEIGNITRSGDAVTNDMVEGQGDGVILFHQGSGHSDANDSDQDGRNSPTLSYHDYELYDLACNFR